MTIKAVNWNDIENPIDLEVWNRLTSNFWLPEKIPLSNDISSWKTLTDAEKEATRKVFGGLTMLDTMQSNLGAPVMMQQAKNLHEEAVFANITFMEAVHAKSYSNIFSTLCSSEEIREIFHWTETNELLQNKGKIVEHYYDLALKTQEAGLDLANLREIMSKGVSVFLESFLFYSGFYLPLKFSSTSKLTNTADIIRLIMRDEGVHGYYIGQKFQRVLSEFPKSSQEIVKNNLREIFNLLYEIELRYTEEIYDGLGWTEHVKTFLRYNGNKAMDNLGLERPFPESQTRVEAAILASMAIDANETHDFFSGSGSSYVIGKAEETVDDDWA